MLSLLMYVLASLLLFMIHLVYFFFFFIMIRRPPRSTLFPTRRSFRSPVARLVDIRAGGNHVFHSHPGGHQALMADRKSTRLNSSHRCISYAVFCLKKKKKKSNEKQKHRKTEETQ